MQLALAIDDDFGPEVYVQPKDDKRADAGAVPVLPPADDVGPGRPGRAALPAMREGAMSPVVYLRAKCSTCSGRHEVGGYAIDHRP